MALNHYEYKKRNMIIWNEIAPRYHKRWASMNGGPFQSTQKLVELVKINENDKVLDVGCGTGVVTKKIKEKIGKFGRVVGIDASLTAINIAKKWNDKEPNLDFINMDAEKFNFSLKFDVVTCQYALFFFPNAKKALKNIRNCLKDGGTLGISVHGDKKSVPFFSSIIDPVTNFIPDYTPAGSPNLDRFGTKNALRDEIDDAGFSKIHVKKFVFMYSPGKFEDYWRNYIKYIAKPLKMKIAALEKSQRKELVNMVRENTKPYTKKNGIIEFPWEVLVLTAKNS